MRERIRVLRLRREWSLTIRNIKRLSGVSVIKAGTDIILIPLKTIWAVARLAMFAQAFAWRTAAANVWVEILSLAFKFKR